MDSSILLIILPLLIFFSFYLTRPYIKKELSELKNVLMRLVVFNILLLIILSSFIVIDNVIKYSFVAYISLFILILISVILYIDRKSSFASIKKAIKNFSFKIFLFDFILLALALKFRFIDKINFTNQIDFYYLFILSFGAWLFGGLIYHHFKSDIDTNYWRYIWKYIKNYIFLIFISLFVLIYLFPGLNGRLKLIEAIFIYSTGSWLFFTIKFFTGIPEKDDIERIKFLRANDFTEKINMDSLLFKGLVYSVNGNSNKKKFVSIDEKLKNIYLRADLDLYEKIKSRVDLQSIDVLKSFIIRSRDPYNVQILPDNSLQLIINLHRLNDIRRINAYLIEVNKKLLNGGIFICCFQSNELRYEYYIKTYPYFLAILFYSLDFIIHRVLPKLPVIQKIYFSITQGNNRAIALSEGLGRLSYTGFNFVDVLKHNHLIYCIVYKAREPSSDPNPSYGLLFKMKRIGKDNKEFYVYKFRTMHPYSEYIQGLMYDLFKLEKGGKIKNDFRITQWGRFLRKIWLDELPMLINLIKGDLKLFGVRPLSKHYFELYPEELKKIRVKTKPGLVPPFYYDLPETFEEILNSEKRYLEAYFKNPLKTDIKYFLKAVSNIIFKNARSA